MRARSCIIAGLMHHWHAVRNVSLPGDYAAFHLGGTQVGWVRHADATTLLDHGCRRIAQGVDLPDPAGLPALARTLAGEGLFAWRGERFDVRATPCAPPLATIDRGALPWFGIEAQGVHVNGLVARPDGLHIWVGRRAASRLMDPGKLDHIIAGGIAAGSTPAETLIKEGHEEAGLPADILRTAEPAGIVSYTTQRPEGLRRDHLHCYDLWLPDGVVPVPQDGEAAEFMLWPLERVIRTLEETDAFKFNVALVLIDLLGRKEAVLF